MSEWVKPTLKRNPDTRNLSYIDFFFVEKYFSIFFSCCCTEIGLIQHYMLLLLYNKKQSRKSENKNHNGISLLLLNDTRPDESMVLDLRTHTKYNQYSPSKQANLIFYFIFFESNFQSNNLFWTNFFCSVRRMIFPFVPHFVLSLSRPRNQDRESVIRFSFISVLFLLLLFFLSSWRWWWWWWCHYIIIFDSSAKR